MSMQNVAIVGEENDGGYFKYAFEHGIRATVEDISTTEILLNLESTFTISLTREDLKNLLNLLDKTGNLRIQYKRKIHQGDFDGEGFYVFSTHVCIGCILIMFDSDGRNVYKALTFGNPKSELVNNSIEGCLEWFKALLS